MIIIIGKASSGKDAVKNALIKNHNYHGITTYTTRPMRKGEIQDVTYHYISEEEFLEKIDNGFFAEWKSYNVEDKTWYYGSAKEDLINADDSTLVILTPDGVRDVKKNGIDAKVIYLYANLHTIRKRLNIRNDINDKAEKRIQRDLKDFKDAEILADKIIYNNDGTNLDDVVKNIVEYVNGDMNEK